MSMTVADVGEFRLIERLHHVLEQEGVIASGVTLGIGDDTASFLPPAGYELLITCDCVVEGRHYLPDFITPVELGRRAMAMNISDIGAMGGKPLYAVVSLGLRADMLVADVEKLYRGFMAELNPFGASVIGGNLTKSDQVTFIDITLIGRIEVGTCIKRSTAQPGDTILVTGYPGQSAGGLRLLLQSPDSRVLRGHPLVQAYTAAAHRAREGRAVAKTGLATAMIDTSDGFLGDLGHICQDSGVGAVLIQEALPLNDNLRQVASQFVIDPYELVLGDSDDYELIITCRPEHIGRIRTAISSVSPVAVHDVGTITDTATGVTLMLPDGTRRDVSAHGWDHFASLRGPHG